MKHRIIIHTERIIPNAEYLDEWFKEMEKTEIPRSVLTRLKEWGEARWETRDGVNNAVTTYRIMRDSTGE